MDRGAWWATVHGITELDMTEQARMYTYMYVGFFLHLCICANLHIKPTVSDSQSLFSVASLWEFFTASASKLLVLSLSVLALAILSQNTASISPFFFCLWISLN